MWVTLDKWAELNMSPAPAINTLRAWANSGLFDPPAQKRGRTWYVEESAEYSPSAPEIQGASDRVLSILRKSA